MSNLKDALEATGVAFNGWTYVQKDIVNGDLCFYDSNKQPVLFARQKTYRLLMEDDWQSSDVTLGEQWFINTGTEL